MRHNLTDIHRQSKPELLSSKQLCHLTLHLFYLPETWRPSILIKQLSRFLLTLNQNIILALTIDLVPTLILGLNEPFSKFIVIMVSIAIIHYRKLLCLNAGPLINPALAVEKAVLDYLMIPWIHSHLHVFAADAPSFCFNWDISRYSQVELEAHTHTLSSNNWKAVSKITLRRIRNYELKTVTSKLIKHHSKSNRGQYDTVMSYTDIVQCHVINLSYLSII